MTLPDAAWRHRPGLDALLAALDAHKGETRYVGGAVRDTLLGLPVSDLDLATRLKPEQVRDRVVEAGLKAVPTGIAHGTITAVLADGPVEVTTLRRDVDTDGRRATVAFSDDWREDAARRDFTINALYADPASGEIIDFFGGRDDLAAGLVRFIGDPLVRIAEDHLRILRFFRFHARFGRGAPDAAGYDACAARANDLMALSRERIADELLKILAGVDPAAPIRLMLDRAILAPVLPELDADGADRLARLVGVEAKSGFAPDRIRRLVALLPQDAAVADDMAIRLRLSNAIRKRMALVLSGRVAPTPQALGYRLGREAAIDRLLLDGDIAAAHRLADWQRPTLPISGGALVERGLVAGPDVARALRAIEDAWIAEDFPDRARVDAITDAILAQALSPRQ
jgi:poly(A) polymerase